MELQNQLDAMSQELARLKGANEPTVQQQTMQQHWSMMQDYMRSMRMMPGMGPRGCADWTMMDWNMDQSMMGCDWMGHGGMMGPGMTRWGMPSLSPSDYQRQMQGRMDQMRKHMAAIAAERDPAKQQTLMRAQYQMMYRDMQTMRGMGWMWTPNASASIPEDKSKGAQLVGKYCSQCHAAPPPSLHTQVEWSQVTARMHGHINDQANGPGSGMKVPSASELEAITDYLGKHAAAAR